MGLVELYISLSQRNSLWNRNHPPDYNATLSRHYHINCMGAPPPKKKKKRKDKNDQGHYSCSRDLVVVTSQLSLRFVSQYLLWKIRILGRTVK